MIEKKKKISRQAKWQAKMKKEKRCVTCGQPAVEGIIHCKVHRRKYKEKNDEYYNSLSKEAYIKVQEYRKQYRLKRVKEKICLRCGNVNNSKDKTWCIECRNKLKSKRKMYANK